MRREVINPDAQGPLKYAPPNLRIDEAIKDARLMLPAPDVHEEEHIEEPPPLVSLERLEQDLAEKDRLKELATLIHALTYGEMITFVSGVSDADKPHDLADRVIKWATDHSNGNAKPVEEEASSPSQ